MLHVAHKLIDEGHKVTIIDNLITGSAKIIPKKAKLFQCDISNKKEVTKIIKNNKFDLVMHFAGLVRVDESVKFPKKYDNYNTTQGQAYGEEGRGYDYSGYENQDGGEAAITDNGGAMLTTSDNEWTMLQDETSGAYYYYNKFTGETQWVDDDEAGNGMGGYDINY